MFRLNHFQLSRFEFVEKSNLKVQAEQRVGKVGLAEYSVKNRDSLEILKRIEEQKKNGDSGNGSGDGSGDGNPDGPGGFDPDNAGQFDSHAEWGQNEANGEAQEAMDIAKERLKEAMKGAAQEAGAKGWGSVSSSCRREIMERITSKVDWKKVLRYFVKTSQKANKASTMTRINRRYPYGHPGRKVQRQAKIAVSIAQSGSVDDGMLALFFGELNQLADLAEFTVVPFDTRVAEDKVYVWKKGERRKRERVMYGGTCFNAPTKYVNEHGFDGHIVLTDLMAPKPIASKCQRMWMTTKYYAERPYFQTNERVIAVD